MSRRIYISSIAMIVGVLGFSNTAYEGPAFLDGIALYKQELTSASAGVFSNNALPVLIISGGRLTCPADAAGDPRYGRHMLTFHNWIPQLIQAAVVARRRTPIIITTCFYRTAVTMRLRSSLDPGRTITAEPEQLSRYLLSIAQSDTYGIEVYMYGHSYGGHLALKTALSLPESLRPRILMTVDAISPDNCYIPSGISSLLDSVLSPRSISLLKISGCTKFPSDFTPLQLQQISLTTRWLNVWQSQNRWLHSGESSAANVNIHLDFGWQTLNGHDDQAIDKRVLNLFAEEWRQSLFASKQNAP